jgi:hypothetical protein
MYNTFKTIIKHTAIYNTADLLVKAVGCVPLPIYIRYLSPADISKAKKLLDSHVKTGFEKGFEKIEPPFLTQKTFMNITL